MTTNDDVNKRSQCDHKQSLMNLLTLEEPVETTQGVGVCQDGPVTLTLLRNAISVAADSDSMPMSLSIGTGAAGKARAPAPAPSPVIVPAPELHTSSSTSAASNVYYSAHPTGCATSPLQLQLQSSSVFYILQANSSSTRLPPGSLPPPAARMSAVAAPYAPPNASISPPPPLASLYSTSDAGVSVSNRPVPVASSSASMAAAAGNYEPPEPQHVSCASMSSADSDNASGAEAGRGHKRPSEAGGGGELRGREILAHVFELQKQREQTGFRSTLEPEQLAALRNSFISNPKPSKKARSLVALASAYSFLHYHCSYSTLLQLQLRIYRYFNNNNLHE